MGTPLGPKYMDPLGLVILVKRVRGRRTFFALGASLVEGFEQLSELFVLLYARTLRLHVGAI